MAGGFALNALLGYVEVGLGGHRRDTIDLEGRRYRRLATGDCQDANIKDKRSLRLFCLEYQWVILVVSIAR
jgi:hypothetical protein